MLLWTSHAALSEQRVEQLRVLFASQMEAAQVRFVRGEAAPALWVSIEQTPSQIVFTARVPGDNSTGIAIEQVPRALAGAEETPGSSARLEKELLWHEQARILSAVLLDAGESGERRLAVLGEETLTVYRGQPGNWRVASVKPLPGPRQTPRSARGQLLLDDSGERLGILLPARRCEASLNDESPVACAGVAAEWPAGRRMTMADCGKEASWLGSDSGDFVSEDRLLLRDAADGKEAPLAELPAAGPVLSISAGPDARSATVVLFNLGSGNYEVYRVAVACGD